MIMQRYNMYLKLKAFISGQRISGKCINDYYVLIMHESTKYTNQFFIYVVVFALKNKDIDVQVFRTIVDLLTK